MCANQIPTFSLPLQGTPPGVPFPPVKAPSKPKVNNCHSIYTLPPKLKFVMCAYTHPCSSLQGTYPGVPSLPLNVLNAPSKPKVGNNCHSIYTLPCTNHLGSVNLSYYVHIHLPLQGAPPGVPSPFVKVEDSSTSQVEQYSHEIVSVAFC